MIKSDINNKDYNYFQQNQLTETACHWPSITDKLESQTSVSAVAAPFKLNRKRSFPSTI